MSPNHEPTRFQLETNPLSTRLELINIILVFWTVTTLTLIELQAMIKTRNEKIFHPNVMARRTFGGDLVCYAPYSFVNGEEYVTFSMLDILTNAHVCNFSANVPVTNDLFACANSSTVVNFPKWFFAITFSDHDLTLNLQLTIIDYY